MTQRVARPMKFAAFISIIISVAVMLAACQGAVGKQGDTGPQGPKGDPGTTGTQGTPGINALIATGGTATILVNNDADNTDTDLVGDTPADWDVSEYFTGGAGELTYEGGDPQTPAFDGPFATSYYTVTVSPAGIASLTVRDTDEEAGVQPVDPDDREADPFVNFVVTATDENGIEAKKRVVVQRNLAPAVVATNITVTGGVGTQDAANPSEDEAVTKVRPNLNQFVVELNVAADNTDNDAHFTDAGPDSVTITAESSHSSVASVAVDGKKVIVTGHTATDDDAATDAPEMVTITLKATDAGRMTSEEKTFTVAVVVAPKAKSSIGSQTYNVGSTAISLVNNIGEFFDPTMDNDNISAKSSDDTKVEIAETEVNSSGHLEGTPKNTGEVTITVTATDGIGQFATQTFQATVKRP